MNRMTTLQIRSYKTKHWTFFLWGYLVLGALFAFPIVIAQLGYDTFRSGVRKIL